MVNIILKNNTGASYAEVRDSICQALVGNRAFIENDIIVSDVMETAGAINIVLGDESNPNEVSITGVIDDIT